MYKNKKIISIIPARGGSKRLPKKNILDLAGKPVIAYSIEQSLNSDLVDRTIVSTEDNEIAEISRKYGAEFIDRPENLSTDKATTLSVLKHVIETLKNQKYNPDVVILLQPTSPLRKTEQIDESIKKLIDNDANAVISVIELHVGYEWLLGIKDERLHFIFEKERKNTRYQDQEKAYELNGAIYTYKTEIIEESRIYNFHENCIALPMDKITSMQIDDNTDFKIIESIIKNVISKDKEEVEK
ncbi:MAG: acylneuraminate cytidylyltransferase family protein [Candidatus Nanoarchaeia archaeon]|nr:acylneuraminate cytidylyltransferase family protein [Candidatus Nanoarchaeia archaeon]